MESVFNENKNGFVSYVEVCNSLEKYLDKWNGFCQKSILEQISNWTFFLALWIELTIVIVEKSEYVIRYEGQWFRLTFVLFGVSLLTTSHSLREWIGLFFFAIFGMVSYKSTGRNEILRFVVFVWACQGKDMKKVLKATFWYTLAGCLVIMFFALTGIYGTVYQTGVFRVEEETRYSFGMGHANSFHCMVFVLTLLGVYCYYNVLHWYSYIILTILHVIVFYFTKSRTSMLLSLFTIVMIVILQYIKPLQKWKGTYILGILSLLAVVAFSVFAAKYSKLHPILWKIDQITTGRISGLYDTYNKEGMLQTWSLWSVARNNYYFDMGIVRIFYWYGIIPGALYILMQIRLFWGAMKKYDYMLLVVLVAISLYSVFEAHFVSVYLGRNYILFFFGLYLDDMFPSIGEKDTESNSVV